MPFAGDGLERGSTVREDFQPPEPLLDGRVLPLSQETLGVGGRFSRLSDTDGWIGTDREQLLLALELVPEAPQLPACRGVTYRCNPPPSVSLYALSAALALRIWASVSMSAP
jgi:hypothetical protein